MDTVFGRTDRCINETTRIDCGDCHLCCQNGMLVILIDGPDDMWPYKCSPRVANGEIIRVLDHQPNGDCVYLGPDGCSIHGQHPHMCRVFDCADFVRLVASKGVLSPLYILQHSVIGEGMRRLRAAKESDSK